MFADLPDEEQVRLVQQALQSLLGDAPRRRDYLALLAATDNVVQWFWQAVRHMPTAEQLLQARQQPEAGPA